MHSRPTDREAAREEGGRGLGREGRGNSIALNSVYERLQGISSHGCVNICLSFFVLRVWYTFPSFFFFSLSLSSTYFLPFSPSLPLLFFLSVPLLFRSLIPKRMILNCWVNNGIDIVYRGISSMEETRKWELKREKGVKWLGAVRGRHGSDVDQNRYTLDRFRWISFEMYFSFHPFHR